MIEHIRILIRIPRDRDSDERLIIPTWATEATNNPKTIIIFIVISFKWLFYGFLRRLCSEQTEYISTKRQNIYTILHSA